MKIVFLSVFLLQPWLLSGLIRFEVLVVFIIALLSLIKGRLTIEAKTFSISLLLMALSLFVTVIHGQFDASYFALSIKLIVVFFGAYILYRYFSLSLFDIKNVARCVSFLCLIFYVACVFSPAFREMSLLFKGATYGLEDKLEFYRLWFPTSAHTFHLGLFFFCILLVQVGIKEKLVWLIPTLICAGVSSRSALLAAIIILALHVAINKRTYIIPSIIIVVSSITFALTLAEESMMVKYAMEPVINIVEGKGVESKSTDKLLEKHLYLPEEKTFFVGDGRYFDEDGYFYGGTDSGIVRPILYGGIVFQIVCLIVLFAFLKSFYRFGIVGIFGAMALLAMNIKAEVLTPSPHFALLSLLYWILRNEKA